MRSAPRPVQPHRPRINQPMGFVVSGLLRPSYYYGQRHDYVYYPEAWTDQNTGTRYAAGYYDENGQYYDSVTFQKDGRYENVVCHCPYCGQNTILNLTAEDVSAHNLQCPHCGGPMEIQSELDDYVNQTAGSAASDFSSEAALRQLEQQEEKKKKRKKRLRRWLIVIAVLVALDLYGSHLQKQEQQQESMAQPAQGVQQLQILEPDPVVEFGEEIVLVKTGEGRYSVSSAQSGDKILVWDAEADSYYDAETDCWVWYNTDAQPAVWQYWVEGISSDFEESGWMEHDSNGWYIEATEWNWIPLPEQYDAAGLWYIE